DRAILIAFIGACLVAYTLDGIFYFQQTTTLWLSFVFGMFGLVIRTIAIFGGVVLQWTNAKKEKRPPLGDDANWIDHALQWCGEHLRFSLAKTTLRVITLTCWLVGAYATVSFFGSGHEIRALQRAGIESVEVTKVDSLADQITALEAENTKLDADK